MPASFSDFWKYISDSRSSKYMRPHSFSSHLPQHSNAPSSARFITVSSGTAFSKRSRSSSSGVISDSYTVTGGSFASSPSIMPRSVSIPMRVAVEMRTVGYPAAAASFSRRSTASLSPPSSISHLFAATILGRAASSGEKLSSSADMVLRSSQGSRPSMPEASTTCTSRRQRSM